MKAHAVHEDKRTPPEGQCAAGATHRFPWARFEIEKRLFFHGLHIAGKDRVQLTHNARHASYQLTLTVVWAQRRSIVRLKDVTYVGEAIPRAEAIVVGLPPLALENPACCRHYHQFDRLVKGQCFGRLR